MSRTVNQTTEVLRHLMMDVSITSVEAIQLYGVTRLAAIIYNLRKRGYDIETLMLEGSTRYGDSVRYAKYIYRGKIDGETSVSG